MVLDARRGGEIVRDVYTYDENYFAEHNDADEIISLF